MEELNCDTAFTIPLFGGIKISESVAVTWIIMAVVVLLCVIFVRNLSVENPGKAQLYWNPQSEKEWTSLKRSEEHTSELQSQR